MPVCLFQIPDKARVTPSSSDPKAKFFELVKVRLYVCVCLHLYSLLCIMHKSFCVVAGV